MENIQILTQKLERNESSKERDRVAIVAVEKKNAGN